MPGPTEGKPQGTECENNSNERRPATQLRSCGRTGDPAQNDEEDAQSDKPQRSATQLGAWAEGPHDASPDSAKLGKLDRHIRLRYQPWP